MQWGIYFLENDREGAGTRREGASCGGGGGYAHAARSTHHAPSPRPHIFTFALKNFSRPTTPAGDERRALSPAAGRPEWRLPDRPRRRFELANASTTSTI